MKYFYLIDRNRAERTAVVTIREIEQRSPTNIRAGAIVAQYETSSVGAVRSAKRQIKQLQSDGERK